MQTSALKRALRNSLLISLVVGGVVIYQGKPPATGLTTALFTLAVTFPALWLSFRYTQSLLERHKLPDGKEPATSSGLSDSEPSEK